MSFYRRKIDALELGKKYFLEENMITPYKGKKKIKCDIRNIRSH